MKETIGDEVIKAAGRRAILETQDKAEIIHDMLAVLAYNDVLEKDNARLIRLLKIAAELQK